MENPVIIDIAKKHGKTTAQVCLRWNLQRNIIVLPKSVTPERIVQNAQVFDFTLSDDEMASIKSLNKNGRFYMLKK